MKDLDQIYAAALDCDPASYQAGNEKFERFVRAATPVAVGAMIEEIRSLRELKVMHQAEMEKLRCILDTYIIENKQLRDKNDELRQKLSDAQKALDGFVIVPIEPSTEQQTAGAQAVRIDTTAINKLFTANRVYRDMIAAAPKIEGL
jgi:regulator of replication initiation timing